jgi:predicted DNA-binding transcriptional regulator AlpA
MQSTNTPLLPETGFVRLPIILMVFPVSRSTWFNGVKEGRYPKSHRIGPRAIAWRVEEIRKLIENAPPTAEVTSHVPESATPQPAHPVE